MARDLLARMRSRPSSGRQPSRRPRTSPGSGGGEAPRDADETGEAGTPSAPSPASAYSLATLLRHQWLAQPGWTPRVPTAVEAVASRRNAQQAALQDRLDVRWQEYQRVDAKFAAAAARRALEERGSTWLEKLHQLYINARCVLLPRLVARDGASCFRSHARCDWCGIPTTTNSTVASGLRRDAQCTYATLWRRTVRAVRHEHGAWADHSDDAAAARDKVHWQLRPHEDSQHRRFQLTRMYNYEDHSDAVVRCVMVCLVCRARAGSGGYELTTAWPSVMCPPPGGGLRMSCRSPRHNGWTSRWE